MAERRSPLADVIILAFNESGSFARMCVMNMWATPVMGVESPSAAGLHAVIGSSRLQRPTYIISFQKLEKTTVNTD